MLLAQELCAPVLIVADIERGGCFASIVGTMQLLETAQRRLVKGFIINKFRGEISLLSPAIKLVQKITRKRILGIIPKIEFELPEEDSLIGSMTGKAEVPRMSWDRQIDLIAKATRENLDMKTIFKVVGF
jgi:adenosylcobyric acid synthase